MSDSTALAVDLRANVKQFERSMKLAANQTEASLRKIEKRFDAANRKLDKDALRTRTAFTSAAGGVDVMTGSVQRWAAVLAGAFSVREVTRMADTFTALQNRLKVAGLAGQELAQVQDHLFKSASMNGVEISALGDLYGRLALSTGELGVSQGELLQFVDGVTASLRVQGTSSQAASGALMQLSQALGAGTVRAEEMNSIMEATPIIAQAAARGMGVSVGQLRQQVVAGEVSSKAFFAALMTGFPEVERQAKDATLTIGQSLTGLRNELLRYVGEQDKALSASDRMAGAIAALTQNIEHIVPVVGGLTAAWGVGYVASALAAGAATKNLDKALMLIRAHPVVATLTVLTAGLTAVALEAQNLDRAMGDLRGSIDRADDMIQTAATNADTGAGAIGDLGGEAVTAAGRMKNFAGETRGAASALYDLARARRAARLEEIENQRREVSQSTATLQLGSRATRRQNFWDELNFSGRNAPSIGESWQRGMRFFAGEWKSLISNGASDADIEQSIQNGLASLRRLDGEARRVAAIPDEVWAEEARRLREGGGGVAAGAGTGKGGGRGGAARAISDEARLVEQLRAEIDRLAYDLLSDTEKAAVDLAQVRDRLKAAVNAGIISSTRAAQLEGGYAAMGLEPAKAPDIRPLDDKSGQDFADAIASGLRAQQAIFDDQGRAMARSFTDILRSGNVGEEIGYRFRDAAFNQLEQVLSTLFSSMASGGGWFSKLTSAMLPGFDQGGYTGSGGVKQAAGIVHKGEVVWSQRDVARAGGVAAVEAMRKGLPGYAQGGVVGRSVIPSVSAALARVQVASAGRAPQPILFDLRGAVMTEDLLQQMNRIGQAAQVGAVATVAAAGAERERKAMYRTRQRLA
jgi:tape measure domain-containing protein